MGVGSAQCCASLPVAVLAPEGVQPNMVDRPAGPQMRIPLGADLRLALDGLIADTGLRASRIIDGALDYAIERCAAALTQGRPAGLMRHIQVVGEGRMLIRLEPARQARIGRLQAVAFPQGMTETAPLVAAAALRMWLAEQTTSRIVAELRSREELTKRPDLARPVVGV